MGTAVSTAMKFKTLLLIIVLLIIIGAIFYLESLKPKRISQEIKVEEVKPEVKKEEIQPKEEEKAVTGAREPAQIPEQKPSCGVCCKAIDRNKIL